MTCVSLIEKFLELENHGNTEVKWHLSSLAPPYVKVSNNYLNIFVLIFKLNAGCFKTEL